GWGCGRCGDCADSLRLRERAGGRPVHSRPVALAAGSPPGWTPRGPRRAPRVALLRYAHAAIPRGAPHLAAPPTAARPPGPPATPSASALLKLVPGSPRPQPCAGESAVLAAIATCVAPTKPGCIPSRPVGATQAAILQYVHAATSCCSRLKASPPAAASPPS